MSGSSISKPKLNVVEINKGQNIIYIKRTSHRATERHLSYGITQCYRPPDRGESAPPNHGQIARYYRFIYPEGMEG